MRAIEVMGEIDTQHQIQARVPESLPPGPVRVLVLIPEEEDTGMAEQARQDTDALTAAMNAVYAEWIPLLIPRGRVRRGAACTGTQRMVISQGEVWWAEF
jgi:hypothetical protein